MSISNPDPKASAKLSIKTAADIEREEFDAIMRSEGGHADDGKSDDSFPMMTLEELRARARARQFHDRKNGHSR